MYSSYCSFQEIHAVQQLPGNLYLLYLPAADHLSYICVPSDSFALNIFFIGSMRWNKRPGTTAIATLVSLPVLLIAVFVSLASSPTKKGQKQQNTKKNTKYSIHLVYNNKENKNNKRTLGGCTVILYYIPTLKCLKNGNIAGLIVRYKTTYS